MSTQTDLLIACLNFVHNAQNERGLATLFLSNRGQRAHDELTTQFTVTDSALERIRAIGPSSGPIFESFSTLALILSRQRTNVMNLSALASNVVTWYTERLVTPAIDFLNSLVLHNNQYSAVRASAFVYLLQWQDRLGHEREMVTQLAGQEWLHDEAFVGRLKKIIRERQTYERLFWGVADDTQQQVCLFLKKSFLESRSPAAAAASRKQDKFSFFCNKIEALHEAAKKITTLLIDENARQTATSPQGQTLDSEIEGHYDIIKALPLFRGIKNDVLRNVLRSARLVQHDKASVFVMQGELTTRFYIVLDGWVKVFKSTTEGDEAILQLLGKRDCVLFYTLFPAGPSPVSARTITKTKLLSLPVSMLRDDIVQHKELALNLLAISSKRTQRLINHFEQLTLRSAKERVGGFLLNLNLDTGIGGPPIVLPFDKSLIANYLGIKPETFSRILQDFRERGFLIDRQQITLPDPYALCTYCDSDTMAKCDLADTDTCPRAESCRIKFA